MTLSEIQRAQVTKRLGAFCNGRVPPHVRDKVRVGFRISDGEVVLFEERPAFRPPHEWREIPVAKFKYVGSQGLWRLYCQHRDLRWHQYEALPTAPSFGKLLDEVAADPTGSSGDSAYRLSNKPYEGPALLAAQRRVAGQAAVETREWATSILTTRCVVPVSSLSWRRLLGVQPSSRLLWMAA